MKSVDTLVQENYNLIFSVLKRFGRQYDVDLLDVAQEALFKAARTYDDNKKVRFSTYAYTCIYNNVGCFLRKEKKHEKDVSIHKVVDNESGMTVGDMLVAPDHAQPEHRMLHSELIEVTKEVVQDIIENEKNPKVKAVIQLYRKSGYTAKTIDIAPAVGVSQSYVSRVIAIFKAAVKQRMEEYVNG